MDNGFSDIDIGARIEYKKMKKILELGPRVFKLCEIKQLEKGMLCKQAYLVHFDGKKWDILIIGSNGIERYVLE